MLIEYLKALLFGVVEGVSEWLPVSSTGHLILLEDIITLRVADSCGEEIAAQYSDAFSVVIQLGAVLAVALIYFRRLLPFSRQSRALWSRLIVATLPAAAIGLLADALCQKTFGKDLDALLFRPEVVASTLIIYGILFILVERMTKGKRGEISSVESISLPTALAVGCFQALALIPGTSRSGATVLGARILGLDRATATEFSFLAALPVIASASGLKLFELADCVSGAQLPHTALLLLIFASGVAFVTSLFTLRALTAFVKRHSFIPFGIYRIILGVAVLMARCG